ncbi:tumor necrosis factor receptor superfamily member 1B [Epinephelus lanceolatus]|uniref:tumor necrosis factor receptor superfamily member 1B isoform X1 n=2 Tax=Epinephelus lanceolatus TaxID=310571 RepID=UPI001445B22A|nr:tumor necrosis factor receptor superfamily member 1B isoform X1 [Epinephelus lanceolatus]
MKDILVLLILLYAQTTKVCSVPYQADSDGNCLDPNKEYRLDDTNLCCKKCPPGQRLIQECTESTETECEPCATGLYMENWNFAQNCRSCPKCKRQKGLQEAQSCSSTTRSRCVCLPGMYCEIGDEHCTACTKYKPCKVGYGVSVPGTGNSDVRCERCPNGTFSDTISFTDRCMPHTDCHRRAVVRKGDAKLDTECGPEAIISIVQPQTSTKEPRIETMFTTASTVMSTVSAAPDSKVPRGLTDSTQSTSPSVSEAVFNHSTKSPPPSTVSDGTLAAAIASVIGFILLLIAVILLALCKPIWRKDGARFHPKVDANGNCETGDKINLGYLGETQLTSFTVNSPEQQCLLQNGEVCSDHSQSSNNTETLTRTDGCSSEESIGPLLSTVALPNPLSALSEPMTLLSNTEPISPQLSVPTQISSQPSSQPTSPQVISPVTPSPHVNVNITFNIANGTCGAPTVTPTDLMQVDSKLPFGEKEESFSIPQQEAGKQSLISVQESESYSA